MTECPVFIAGQWRAARSSGQFQAHNPTTGEALPASYPISSWDDCDTALGAAVAAAHALDALPGERIAAFLERYAARIQAAVEPLVDMAHAETGLPKTPRLKDVELPRTVNQLQQAAAAARDGSWALPTIDTRANIRSQLAPLGPVWVFGPNNFPFAFNSVAGGDFAAALAAGNPVIAKANTSHPGTTRLLMTEAAAALGETDLPSSTVQLLYRTSHADGERLVADPRTGAVGYTGSRTAGLRLKAAADAAGKPIYLELSSVNPVVILPGVLRERGPQLADEFTTSCLMGTGQFCTNPGLIVLLAGDDTEQFIGNVVARFQAAAPGVLLSAAVQRSLTEAVATLRAAGAELLVGGSPSTPPGYRFANTLLRATGRQFVAHAERLQTEAFGNASLLVVAADVAEAEQVLEQLEGNLTGCLYSATGDERAADDALYARLAPILRRRVGRLLNDKMPTGVAVSPAMNHGGPFPATGHPGFTAVGIPAALRRFAMLACYDGVRPERLPAALQNRNPTGHMWRLVDGRWTQDDVTS